MNSRELIRKLFKAIENNELKETSEYLDLITPRCKINEIKNDKGQTLLMAATKQGNVDIFKLILSKNADPNIKDAKGMSPVDYLIDCYEKTLKLLSSTRIMQSTHKLKLALSNTFAKQNTDENNSLKEEARNINTRLKSYQRDLDLILDMMQYLDPKMNKIVTNPNLNMMLTTTWNTRIQKEKFDTVQHYYKNFLKLVALPAITSDLQDLIAVYSNPDIELYNLSKLNSDLSTLKNAFMNLPISPGLFANSFKQSVNEVIDNISAAIAKEPRQQVREVVETKRRTCAVM